MNNGKIASRFVPIAAILVGICGLIYVVAQQAYRMSANDPQIQLAEDAARGAAEGKSPYALVPNEQIDIATSLAPFVLILDDDKVPQASSARLNNVTPTIPPGVLDYAKEHGESRITWEPENGVRAALVVVRFKGEKSGYVVAGRSLREVERRESHLTFLVGTALFSLLAVSFLSCCILPRRVDKNYTQGSSRQM